MFDESLEHVERRMAALQPTGALHELRATVLAKVQRELRASRWDRRLARVAAVLLVVGVGLNAGIALNPAVEQSRSSQMATSNARQSLVNTAMVVAEATDAKTGSEYARQMAAMIGHVLTADDVAAIDEAINRTRSQENTNERKG